MQPLDNVRSTLLVEENRQFYGLLNCCLITDKVQHRRGTAGSSVESLTNLAIASSTVTYFFFLRYGGAPIPICASTYALIVIILLYPEFDDFEDRSIEG
jgi:hypothetical protein